MLALGWLLVFGGIGGEACFELVLAEVGQSYLDKSLDQAQLLNQIAWQSKPTLVDADIREYRWVTHSLLLHRSAVDHLPAMRDVVSHRYFKIRVDGIDLYVGVFLPASSLRTSSIPVIKIREIGANQKGEYARESSRHLTISFPALGILDSDVRSATAIRSCFEVRSKLVEF